jgi:endogenous inhibitor of DNA gyrase (YacG/DUF329 family)
MQLVTTELGTETVESNIISREVGCQRCGAQATLQSTYLYRPQFAFLERRQDEVSSSTVMIVKCPICGPQTQVQTGDRIVSY